MKTAHFLKPDESGSQDLSAGALSVTTTFSRKFKLEGIYIHFSVAVTETITITLDALAGTAYDTRLRRRSLSSEQDFVYKPEGELNLQDGDEINCNAPTPTQQVWYII